MSYIGNEPIVSATRTITEVSATAGQTVFTPNGGYTVGYIDVFVNGAQLQTSDFTATNGTTVTLNSGASAGDDVRLVAWGTFSTATHVPLTGNSNITGNINVSGNLGVGTTSPSSKLHVKNDSNPIEVYPSGTWAGQVYNANDVLGSNGLVVGNRWAADNSTVFEAGSIYGNGSGSWSSYYKITGVGTHIWGSGGAGTERMRIDGSGRVTMPYQPTFSIYSMSHRASDTWNGGSVLVNKGSFSYNSSTGVITVPASGTYLIHTHMLYNTANNGAQMVLRINGAFQDEAFVHATSGSSSGLGTASLSTIRTLAAGDTISVYTPVSGWYSNATGNAISVVMLN